MRGKTAGISFQISQTYPTDPQDTNLDTYHALRGNTAGIGFEISQTYPANPPT